MNLIWGNKERENKEREKEDSFTFPTFVPQERGRPLSAPLFLSPWPEERKERSRYRVRLWGAHPLRGKIVWGGYLSFLSMGWASGWLACRFSLITCAVFHWPFLGGWCPSIVAPLFLLFRGWKEETFNSVCLESVRVGHTRALVPRYDPPGRQILEFIELALCYQSPFDSYPISTLFHRPSSGEERKHYFEERRGLTNPRQLILS